MLGLAGCALGLGAKGHGSAPMPAQPAKCRARNCFPSKRVPQLCRWPDAVGQCHCCPRGARLQAALRQRRCSLHRLDGSLLRPCLFATRVNAYATRRRGGSLGEATYACFSRPRRLRRTERCAGALPSCVAALTASETGGLCCATTAAPQTQPPACRHVGTPLPML